MSYELKQVGGMRGEPTLTFRADCEDGTGVRILIPDGQVFEIYIEPEYLNHPKVYFHFGERVQDEDLDEDEELTDEEVRDIARVEEDLPYPDESGGND